MRRYELAMENRIGSVYLSYSVFHIFSPGVGTRSHVVSVANICCRRLGRVDVYASPRTGR